MNTVSKEPFFEDDALLREFGIRIPEHSLLPKLFLKLYPSDFIVEEIDQNGNVSTIDLEKVIENITDEPLWHATLVKCNIGTHDALLEIASKLKISESDISYAGLKDEFALTAQAISIRGVAYEQLKNISSPFYFLKNIRKGEVHIKKGSLKGNRFTITLRTIKIEENTSDALDRAVERVSSQGFFNFYYLQRFGLPRLNNHYIASLLLHGDYEGTMRVFLCEKGIYAQGETALIREKAELIYGNWKDMISLYKTFPKVFQYELVVLRHLEQYPRDITGALEKIPHITTLWVYSLSSWLFNTELSQRIEKNNVPDQLPLFLTSNQRDLKVYEYLLKKLQAFPPDFSHIKKINSQIEVKSRYVDTRVKVLFNGIQKTEGAVVLSFDLGKGSYATTLLAHIAQLVSYVPPEGVKTGIIDAKKVLGTGTLENLEKALIDAQKPVFTEEPSRI